MFMRLKGMAIAAVVAAGGALPAMAQENEGPPAEILRWALQDVQDPTEVFRIEGEHLVHVQTGMTCPAYFQNAFLVEAYVFDSEEGRGMDVGCDYARRLAPGSNKTAAKHTLYAVKLPVGATFADYFDAYNDSMRNTVPDDAQDGGQSLHFDDPPDGFPRFDSAELFFTDGGRERQTEMLLAEMDGWLIKVRSSKASQYAISNEDEAVDQTVSSLMFFHAIADLGGPVYEPDFEFEPARAN